MHAIILAAGMGRRLNAGEPVLPIEVGHLPCGEIDFPEDLRHAVADIAPRLL
jgi:choline kinase